MNLTQPLVSNNCDSKFSEADFNKLTRLIYSISGILLNQSKKSLLSSRITKRLRSLHIKNISSYIRFLDTSEGKEEYINLIDVISTNYTFFFREEDHFDYLGQHFSKLQGAGQRKFRVWSCASSTGEEPYSIALQLLNTRKSKIDVKILATDISISVLEECKKGIYSKDRLGNIPKEFMRTGFEKVLNNPDYMKVKDVVKNLISFNWINLSATPFPMQGPFDFIFCRNVMIYFDDAVRQNLVNEIYKLLAVGGIFVVGHSESLNKLNHNFKTLSASVYQKV